MPSVASYVRKISKKIIPQKPKDGAEPVQKAHAHSDVSEEEHKTAERAPAQKSTLTQLSSINSRNSSFKSKQSCASPIAPPSPKLGPETQTSGDFEGLSHKELMRAMILDARSQEDLVELCAEIIAATVQRNDSREYVKAELSAFEGETVKISAKYYVRRIFKYGGCSACCLAIGCLYLQRLKARYHCVRLNSRTFIRLLAVAVMSASKFFDDHFVSNKQWADIAGVSVQEMNQLELEFLFRIQFDLCVDREAYNSCVAEMLGLDVNGEPLTDELVRTSPEDSPQGEKFERPAFSSLTDVTEASENF